MSGVQAIVAADLLVWDSLLFVRRIWDDIEGGVRRMRGVQVQDALVCRGARPPDQGGSPAGPPGGQGRSRTAAGRGRQPALAGGRCG